MEFRHSWISSDSDVIPGAVVRGMPDTVLLGWQDILSEVSLPSLKLGAMLERELVIGRGPSARHIWWQSRDPENIREQTKAKVPLLHYPALVFLKEAGMRIEGRQL